MPKRKPKKNPYRPCNRDGCMNGLCRVIVDGVSAVRRCGCYEVWKRNKSTSVVDGKAKAANG